MGPGVHPLRANWHPSRRPCAGSASAQLRERQQVAPTGTGPRSPGTTEGDGPKPKSLPPDAQPLPGPDPPLLRSSFRVLAGTEPKQAKPAQRLPYTTQMCSCSMGALAAIEQEHDLPTMTVISPAPPAYVLEESQISGLAGDLLQLGFAVAVAPH